MLGGSRVISLEETLMPAFGLANIFVNSKLRVVNCFRLGFNPLIFTPVICGGCEIYTVDCGSQGRDRYMLAF